MDELSDFLRTFFYDQKRQVETVFKITADVLPVFSRFWDDKTKQWPYQLKTNEPLVVPDRYSTSTNSMITFALSVVMGGITESVLLPALRRPMPLIAAFPIPDTDKDALRKTFASAYKALLAQVSKTTTENGVSYLTKSDTYGVDDPFTLTWLSELLI